MLDVALSGKDVISEIDGDVFRICLNRPQKRNALSVSMIGAVSDALDAAATDPAARVIVVSARGPVFSSGHDLKEMTAARDAADGGRKFFADTMKACSAMMQRVTSHRLPVIAAVQGPASAAGCQLVAACDLAVAADTATFTTPGVNIGLFCSTPMVALSRNVPNKHAMEMLLTGESISARRAAKIGLVNRAVPGDEVDGTVQEFTERIAAKSKVTLKIGKEAFYRQAEMTLDEAYEYCSQVMVENMMKQDAQEGISAFLEKREANWRDA